MAQVKERGGGGEERKETLAGKPRDFENHWPVMPEFAHRHLNFRGRVCEPNTTWTAFMLKYQ